MERIGRKGVILPLLCIAASIATAIHLSNTPKGIIHGIIFGLLFAFIFVALMLFLELWIKSKTIVKFAHWCIGIIAIISVIAWQWYHLSPSTTRIYEMILYSEPPVAVTDLKGHCEHRSKDATYRLRFTTDSAHFHDIFSRFAPKSPFLHILNLDRRDSLLWWDNEMLKSLPVYIWTDDRWDRTLWYVRQEDTTKYTVYLLGYGTY